MSEEVEITVKISLKDFEDMLTTLDDGFGQPLIAVRKLVAFRPRQNTTCLVCGKFANESDHKGCGDYESPPK